MKNREQELEIALRELVQALEELGCPYCWRKGVGRDGNQAEEALARAKEALLLLKVLRTQ